MEKYTLHTMDASKMRELVKKSTFNEYFIRKNIIVLSICERPIAEIDCSDSETQGTDLQEHLVNLFRLAYKSFIKISR